MLYAALVSTAPGFASAAPDVEQIGTDLLLIVLGVAIAWFAARSQRRFSAAIGETDEMGGDPADEPAAARP